MGTKSMDLNIFLPMPLAGAWVNRWTFSPPFPSHLQIFVPTQLKNAQVLFLPGREKLKFFFCWYRKRHGGCGSLAVYAILFN